MDFIEDFVDRIFEGGGSFIPFIGVYLLWKKGYAVFKCMLSAPLSLI